MQSAIVIKDNNMNPLRTVYALIFALCAATLAGCTNTWTRDVPSLPGPLR
jgi:hypothetical protein